MATSILTTTKKAIGLGENDTTFDVDIVMHINSTFATLFQLGVGPQDAAYSIEDKADTWEDFLAAETDMNSVQSYMYMKVKLMFDPPPTSFAIEAIQKQTDMFEWRLNVVREEKLHG